MDPTNVTEFLQKIMDQLGPAGQQAFQIVAARVFAESVIWVITGFVILVITLLLTVVCVLGYRHEKNYDDKGLWIIIGGGVFIIGLGISLLIIVPNAFNLMSIEYATIARILNLVGDAKP